MATKAWVAKQKRREALVKKYADLRRQLKKEKNFAALAKLPRDSSPTRSHNRCQLTGRSRGVSAQVQGFAHHASRAGAGRQNPGSEESKLVDTEGNKCDEQSRSHRGHADPDSQRQPRRPALVLIPKSKICTRHRAGAQGRGLHRGVRRRSTTASRARSASSSSTRSTARR